MKKLELSGIEEQAKRIVKPLLRTEKLFLPNYEYNVYKALSTSLLAVEGVNVKNKESLLTKREIKKVLDDREVLDSKYVISFLIDTIGYRNISQSILLTKMFEHDSGILLSSIFPTVTPAVLTSIATASPPEEHGILGHKIYIDEIGNIVDTIAMLTPNYKVIDALPMVGVNVRKFLWNSMIFDNIIADDDFMRAKVLLKRISKKGLSWFLIDDFNYVVGFDTLVDCMAIIKQILEKYSEKKIFIEIYLAELDEIAHLYGPYSDEYKFQMRVIEQHLWWLLKSLNDSILKKGSLFMFSDHGQVNLHEDKRVIIEKDEIDEIKDWLKYPPGVSGRVYHFYVKDEYINTFINWIGEKINGNGIVIKTEDKINKFYPKLTTQNRDRVITRIGDVQVIFYENASLKVKTDEDKKEEIIPRELKATHGSLTLQELVVPFVFSRLNEAKDILSKSLA